MNKFPDEPRDVGEVCFLLVLAPFVLALAFFGCSLAVASGRFFFDIVANSGRVPCGTDPEVR